MELVRAFILFVDVLKQKLLEKATAKGVALGRQEILEMLEMTEADITSMKERSSESSPETEVTEKKRSHRRIPGFAPTKHNNMSRKLGNKE